jgi:hypothetical protein
MSTRNVNRAEYYRYVPDSNNYRGMALQEGDYDLIWIHSKFQSLAAEWRKPVVKELEDSPPKLGDFPSLVNRNCIPLFSEKAWIVFEPYLSDIAEALPVATTKRHRLFIVHVHRRLDLLLPEKCEYDRFSDGGVRRINRFCFDKIKSDSVLMAKLPPDLGGDLLVSEKFRRIAEENALEGLLFTEVPQLE